MAKLIRNQGQGSKDAVAVVPRASFERLGVEPDAFPRYCASRDTDVLVSISPTSFRYLSRIGESKRDDEIVGALPFADVNDRERLWSCDFAMLHGARTEDEVRDWEARVGVKSQSRVRLRLDVPRAGATGSVFFDGSDDDVRQHLANVFGTDAFRLEGREIVLELPLVGFDKRPRPSGETTHVRVEAPEEWTIQASERSWWHVVPHETSATLCGIELSTWLTPPREDDEQRITCPWCRARMLAIELVAPPRRAAEGSLQPERPFVASPEVIEGIAQGLTPDQIYARHGRRQALWDEAIHEEAWVAGEHGSFPPTPANVAELRDKHGHRWERIAVRIFGDPRRSRDAQTLYDEAKGRAGAAQESYTGRGRRFPKMER